MTAQRLDGRRHAQAIRQEVAQQAAAFLSAHGQRPHLAAVLVGEDPASEVYVRNKQKDCEQAGLDSQLVPLPQDTSTEALLGEIARLNADPRVHGILVQLPLPPQIDAEQVLEAIDPLKDVDAFHPENVGRLTLGRPRFQPCTPAGIIELLAREGLTTEGRRAVVVGRSDIVGKPMALLLLQSHSRGNATVTVCHSRTRDLAEITRDAELLIVAAGRPGFITGEMVQPGAVVIDVGIHRTASGLVGDVDFASVSPVAGHLTPVPGGVGPLTRAMLLCNTLTAAQLQHPAESAPR